MAELSDRFISKVSPEPMSGCWLWMGAIKSNGYAVFSIARKAFHAHRVAYESANGDIPEGKVIDHLCRNRMCVNPQHLEAVSQRENVLRGQCGAVNAARQSGKTHCPQGHVYEGHNLIVNSVDGRECRQCNCAKAKRCREHRARNS